MSLEQLLFLLFAVASVGSGLGVAFIPDPVKAAMSLIACFFSIACLYLLQAAELIAVLEVLVYAGAIMVLFVFVIMLVENKNEPLVRDSLWSQIGVFAKVFAVMLVTMNVVVALFRSFGGLYAGAKLPKGFGSPEAVGREFFKSFLFQFELASVLLLVAIVGAVIISGVHKPEDTKDRP